MKINKNVIKGYKNVLTENAGFLVLKSNFLILQ